MFPSLGLHSYDVLFFWLLLWCRTGLCPALGVLDDVVLLLMLRPRRRSRRLATPPGGVYPRLPAPTFVGRSSPPPFCFFDFSYILVYLYTYMCLGYICIPFCFDCFYLVFLFCCFCLFRCLCLLLLFCVICKRRSFLDFLFWTRLQVCIWAYSCLYFLLLF